jgi:hypothetical protein
VLKRRIGDYRRKSGHGSETELEAGQTGREEWYVSFSLASSHP